MYEISQSAREILSNPEFIRKHNQWLEVLGALFQGSHDAYLDKYVYTVEGFVGSPEHLETQYNDVHKWVAECLEDLAKKVLQVKNEERFIPFCIEYPLYGVHFIDSILGADVFFQDGQWNARYLNTPIGTLQEPDLAINETWIKAQTAAQCFLSYNLPLVLFGEPTLSSALNIAVNLYGQDALLAMIEEPDAISHDLKVINSLICNLHRWYIQNVPQTQLQPVISWCRTQSPGNGQLCGCSTQLVSADLYDRFIAALDNELLGLYSNGGMIHLCGSHAQHIESFRKMQNLKAIQINDRAAHDLEKYYTGLRNDQIIYLNPCEGMGIDEAINITGGNRLVICAPVAAPHRK
jgi:hypothetical protein